MNFFFVLNIYRIKCLLCTFLLILILAPVLSGCASGGCGLEGERPCASRDYYIPGKGAWASRSESPGEKFLRELFFPKSKKHKTTIKNFDKSEQKYATKMIRETLKNNQDGQLSSGKVHIIKEFLVLLDQFQQMVIVENLFLMFKMGMNLFKLEALLV